MPWAVASAVVAVVGAAVSAYSQYESGQAQKASANYNSEVAANNAEIASQTATRAAQAGEAQAEATSQKTRATVGAITASQAAGNIDVNSGSALDVQSSAKELGELDALTVRSNAAKTAYGYQTQSASDTGQSQLDAFQAANAGTAGEISAGGSILGGVSNAAGNYGKFLLQNSSLSGGGSVGQGAAAIWEAQ